MKKALLTALMIGLTSSAAVAAETSGVIKQIDDGVPFCFKLNNSWFAAEAHKDTLKLAAFFGATVAFSFDTLDFALCHLAGTPPAYVWAYKVVDGVDVVLP